MENNNQNLTVWQRLSKTFGPNSTLGQDQPDYKLDKKEILKTQDKNEYEKLKLQGQQSLYLSSNWTKVENNLYTQAVYMNQQDWPLFMIMNLWSILQRYRQLWIFMLKNQQHQTKMDTYFKCIQNQKELKVF